MKYLVLGGAGFQGRHLVERLLMKGNSVRVYDKNVSCPDYQGARNKYLEYIPGSLSNIEAFETLVRGIDVVFHLISTTLPKTSNDDPVNDVRDNIIPTIHLLESARQAGVNKVIYFSSGGTVYGAPKVIPTPETHSTLPLCSYGIHKLAIEHYLHLFFTLYGLDYAIMRVSNPYGIYQSTGGEQGAIPVFLNKLLHDEPINIWGDGSVTRDYIHVDDVIDGAMSLLAYQGTQKIFNIGSGKGITLNDLIAELSILVGRKSQVNYLPGRPLDVPVSVLDISRATQELSWRPRVVLREGLVRLIEQRRSSGFQNEELFNKAYG